MLWFLKTNNWRKGTPYTCLRTRDERRPNLGRVTFESGTRDVRIWEQMRPSLGAETVERGMAFADKWRDRITITKYVVLERVTREGRDEEGGTRPSSRILFPVVRSWRRDKC